jgi:hypothetical protein
VGAWGAWDGGRETFFYRERFMLVVFHRENWRIGEGRLLLNAEIATGTINQYHIAIIRGFIPERLREARLGKQHAAGFFRIRKRKAHFVF